MASLDENVPSDDRLKAASIRKTELEIKVLEEQLTPNYKRRETLKAIAAASGFVIALVAVFGGILSVLKWIDEQANSRKLRVEERLDHTLTLLSEGKANQQVAAINSLQSFILPSADPRNIQVLVSIANALPLVETAIVRNAILSLFEGIEPALAGRPALDAALKSLAQNSRSLVRETNLWHTRPSNLFDLEITVKQGPSLQAVARALAVLLRKGARSKDLSGLYLGRSDLSHLDLTGSNFHDSILAASDFAHSTLEGAIFDDADLESVGFKFAKLRGASFVAYRRGGFEKQKQSDISGKPKRSYIREELDRATGDTVRAAMPDFSCADLRNAQFAGQPLFFFVPDRLSDRVSIRLAYFHGANLEGADLANIAVVTVTSKVENPIFISVLNIYVQDAWNLPSNGLSAGIWGLTAETEFNEKLHDFAQTVSMGSVWLGSNWASTNLPKGIKVILSGQPSTPETDIALASICPPDER